MNSKAFFARIRQSQFNDKISQSAVDNMNVILQYWNTSAPQAPDAQLAYVLATVFGEVGKDMHPVREGFCKTDADARAFVKRHGYKYAQVVNGQVYYGRGYVQLTWDYNYKKMGAKCHEDLYDTPDNALVPEIAVRVLVQGMTGGDFTGKSLGSYITETQTDFVNARRIINGLDRAHDFAHYATNFLDAIEYAQSTPAEDASSDASDDEVAQKDSRPSLRHMKRQRKLLAAHMLRR